MYPIVYLDVHRYEEVLHPVGFRAVSILDNELAIGPRKVCKFLINIYVVFAICFWNHI